MRVVQPNGNIKLHWDEKAGEAGLQKAVEFVEKFDGAHGGMVRGMLAPERIESQTAEQLKQIKYYSEKLDVPIKLHAAQGSFEFNTIWEAHHVTPIRYLYDLGFLVEVQSISRMPTLFQDTVERNMDRVMTWRC